MGTAEVVTRLLDYWSRKYGMVQGSRNSNLLILAQWMNEHGVPQADALAACLPMEDRSGSDPFTATEIRQVVGSAYRRTVAGSGPWITGARQRTPPPPQAHPYRYTGASLSPTDRAALVEVFAKAMRQELAMATEPQHAEQVSPLAPAAPAAPLTAGEQALQRMATINPALNTLSQAFDLDLSRARFSTPSSEQVNRPRHERENWHAAIALDLHRELPHLAPYTLALELFVRSGGNLSGQQVAKLLRDAGDQ
jgi:hypothetical protein